MTNYKYLVVSIDGVSRKYKLRDVSGPDIFIRQALEDFQEEINHTIQEGEDCRLALNIDIHWTEG